MHLSLSRQEFALTLGFFFSFSFICPLLFSFPFPPQLAFNNKMKSFDG